METIYELQNHIEFKKRKQTIVKASHFKPLKKQGELFTMPQIHKQTPLQPAEIQLLATAPDINKASRDLKLSSRPSVPLEIVRAYESLKNPQDLSVWGRDPKNLALHRLAVEANRGSFIRLQSSEWGTQYSQVVNFWLLAQPQYRHRKYLSLLQPLTHPELFEALNCWDPKLELSREYRLQLRQQLLEAQQKPAQQIYRPRISNSHNLVPLNWVVILELWVCVPQLQHPNQLLDLLGHQPLHQQALFQDQ